MSCDGTLKIGGIRICDTAEPTRYRVAAGRYRVALRHNRLLHRKVPVLLMPDEPGTPAGLQETPPYLCMGNGVYACRDARILLGTYIAPGCLKQSRQPFMLLYDRIKKTLARGQEVSLLITDC